MSDEEIQRSKFLKSMARGVAYAAPVLAVIAGGAAIHGIVSDAVTESGYHMAAVGEAEAEAEARPE
ncbi:MAG: hypothetical protein ACNA7W_00660, partial [Pseudomonadales bacterium]